MDPFGCYPGSDRTATSRNVPSAPRYAVRATTIAQIPRARTTGSQSMDSWCWLREIIQIASVYNVCN
jgi:hypothetical protein